MLLLIAVVVPIMSVSAGQSPIDSSLLANYSCELRYTFVRTAQNRVSCPWLRERYPMCGQDIQLLFSDFPPYNYKEDRPKGILTEMIRLIFHACCLGCTNLTFIGPLDYIGKYTDNRTSIIIPVETSKSSERFFQMDYLYLLEIPGVSFFISKTRSDAEQMTRDLFNSVLATWPLFVTALLMAVLAGFAVWALDTWFNVVEFPRSFLKGPFEGFWWAFVSMTTVGYGDRAPKSYVARVFAIVWIFLGITIFSMYSASLTTALTSTVSTTSKVSVSGKRVGYLNTTTSGHSAALKENAVTVPYKSIDDALEDLKKQKIYGLALDDNLANYNMKYMKKKLPSIRFSYRVKMTSHSYGMVLVDRTTPPGALKHFFKTFFENNEDQREVIAAEAMRGLERADHTQDTPLSAFSHESPIFLLTLIALTGIGAFLVIVGILIHLFSNRAKKTSDSEDNRGDSCMDNNCTALKREMIKLLPEEETVLELSEENGNGLNNAPVQWDQIEEEFLKECKQFFIKWKTRLNRRAAAVVPEVEETGL